MADLQTSRLEMVSWIPDLSERVTAAADTPANADAPFVVSEVQLMYAATVSFQGETLDIDERIFNNFIRNFELGAQGVEPGTGRGKPLPIYRDHQMHGSESYGRIISLRHDGNALWARIKWNADGVDLIVNEKYNQQSVEFTLNYRDAEGRMWGETLHASSLVNEPRLANMVSVAFGNDKPIYTLKGEVEDNAAYAIQCENDHASLICFSRREYTMAENEQTTIENEPTPPPQTPPAAPPQTDAETDALKAKMANDAETRALRARMTELQEKLHMKEAEAAALKASNSRIENERDAHKKTADEMKEAVADELLKEFSAVVLERDLYFIDSNGEKQWTELRRLASEAPEQFRLIASRMQPPVETGEEGAGTSEAPPANNPHADLTDEEIDLLEKAEFIRAETERRIAELPEKDQGCMLARLEVGVQLSREYPLAFLPFIGEREMATQGITFRGAPPSETQMPSFLTGTLGEGTNNG